MRRQPRYVAESGTSAMSANLRVCESCIVWNLNTPSITAAQLHHERARVLAVQVERGHVLAAVALEAAVHHLVALVGRLVVRRLLLVDQPPRERERAAARVLREVAERLGRLEVERVRARVARRAERLERLGELALERRLAVDVREHVALVDQPRRARGAGAPLTRWKPRTRACLPFQSTSRFRPIGPRSNVTSYSRWRRARAPPSRSKNDAECAPVSRSGEALCASRSENEIEPPRARRTATPRARGLGAAAAARPRARARRRGRTRASASDRAGRLPTRARRRRSRHPRPARRRPRHPEIGVGEGGLFRSSRSPSDAARRRRSRHPRLARRRPRHPETFPRSASMRAGHSGRAGQTPPWRGRVPRRRK